MFRTPIKNSKSVNKPFKSPFDSSFQNKKENKVKNVSKNENCKAIQSPVSTRFPEAKRILLMDADEEENEKPEITNIKAKDDETTTSKNTTKTELLILKRKIFEMRQELDCLKSRERCMKKHNPKDLKISIKRWRSACQAALETIASELTEKNGQNTKIADVLNMLNIPENIVHYSEKEDSFI